MCSRPRPAEAGLCRRVLLLIMYSFTHQSAKDAFRWSNVYSPHGLTGPQSHCPAHTFVPWLGRQ